MSFRTNDCKTAGLLYLRSKLDVSTTAGHVGGNGDGPGFTCLRNYLCLTLMQLGVEHIVLQPLHLEHTTQKFGYLNRGCTNQNRSSCLVKFDYLINDSIIFLPLGLVHKVLMVIPYDLYVGWDYHHIKLVYIPEFTCFGNGRPGHPCELVVHPEVVLEGDGGIGLGGSLHLHVFL